ncbi:MAG: DUF1549 domain-containing protein [Verrucomicrobiales bacterium]
MKNLLSLLLSVSVLVSISASAGQPQASAAIDGILEKSWKEAGVKPSAIVDDETFVRRIFLDAVGRIPTAAEIDTFMGDDSKSKRADLINELLDSEGYTNHMFNFWADILRIHSQQGGGQNIVPAYVRYVKDSLRKNKPYDEFVRELITAEGETYSNGAIGYYYRDRGMPLDNMANTVRIFLGTRLECAQCHNHPFDKWTQMDFYHMAAFSYGVNVQNRQGGAMFQEIQREMNSDKKMDRDDKRNMQRALQEIRRPIRNTPVLEFQPEKMPQLPHDYQYDDAKPKEKVAEKVMFGKEPEIASPGQKLFSYADWMASAENPRFTKVIANRMWKKVMGLGLVEPVDEILDSTIAANPELLEFLEEEMKRQKYDLKGFLRVLFNTEVYQREPSQTEVLVPADYAFTGPVMRRLSAEQIWDSIVTMVNPKPELGNWRRDQEAILRNVGADMLNTALQKKSKNQLMKDIKVVANAQKNLQGQLLRLQKEQADARKAKDQDKVKSLAKKTNEIRRQLTNKVYSQVYSPMLKKGIAKRIDFETPEGMGEFAMKIEPNQLDQNGRVKPDVMRQLSKKEEEFIQQEMDGMGLNDQRERRNYLSFRKNMCTNYLRAANMESPARPGHFLRQFGQSDRETIENAESAASVTQALTMLNGPIFQTVSNPQSVISRELKKVETPEEKLELIYLSVLSRKPDADEKSIILADAEQRSDGLFQDVIFALLNSQEFYFVK